jgi:hypothetical protein
MVAELRGVGGISGVSRDGRRAVMGRVKSRGDNNLYLLDLQTAQEIHFAYRLQQDLPVEPDIAFTASSIIKIPIMISSYRRMGEEAPDEEARRLLVEVITKSGNETADWLMERVIDPVRGPLIVSEDMQAIGLQNTYLAGYFTPGSPLLQSFQTPANQRADISTDPDPYSQTTTSDMGMLLSDLYQCAQTGGGTLPAVFPAEITQLECQSMVETLAGDELGLLIQASVPDGTRVAHKHGWVSTFGIVTPSATRHRLHAGRELHPGHQRHHPGSSSGEPASRTIADISCAVYNYYNVPTE